ncbi:MAG TPA: hypothetical protein VH143_03845 [Kofleriaceae bacterium]|nr:hypothetical protein [Kofleriaceae bacterium]
MAAVLRPQSSTFACGHCGAELAFAGVRTEICPYCASPNIAGDVDGEHVAPLLIVPFTVDAAAARHALGRWLGARRVFADGAFAAARIDRLHGVYVPAYLYGAVATTDYSAHIGENYTETETYTAKDERGREVTKTRTITRTEYRVLSGRHVGYVADVVVSASAGMSHAELASAGAFDLSQLRRFQPELISGWMAEHFSRDADACMRASRAEAGDQIGDELRRFMPGDSFSDLAYRTTVSWESLDPVLVPVWVLAVRYRDDKPALRVTINGQTGEVAGRVPLAWWKLAVAIATLAAIAAALWWRLHA